LKRSKHALFVFTAVADEYSVRHISETRFVRDETCIHTTKSTTQHQVVLCRAVYS